MAGLIDSEEGLVYGEGLIFEAGLGGAGLVNPLDRAGPLARAAFAGAGTLSVNATRTTFVTATFAGSGSLQQ